MLMRADRSMCSAGWANPRSVASDSAMISSLSRTPESATTPMLKRRAWGEYPMMRRARLRTVEPRFARQGDDMPKYLIERTVPGAGQMDDAALAAIATKSNEVLRDLG